MDLGNIITILGILATAIAMFFGLKNQVEKITIVVENNTREISLLRKLIERIADHNDKEHDALKTKFEDIDGNLKSHGIRIYELEKKIGVRT